MVKLLVRVFLGAVVVIVGVGAYLAVAAVDVSVTARGCGALQPPGFLTLSWQATADGGIARVPPLTVHVDTAMRHGQETLTVTAPAGINAPFAIGDNLALVAFDGMPLFQRAALVRSSATVDLGKMRHHHLVLDCR